MFVCINVRTVRSFNVCLLVVRRLCYPVGMGSLLTTTTWQYSTDIAATRFDQPSTLVIFNSNMCDSKISVEM